MQWVGFDQFLGRRSLEIRARISRLNPDPVFGSRIRGWFPHRRSYSMVNGTLPVRDFVQQFGGDAYRLLPKEAFMRNGKRQSIRMEFIQDNRHLRYVSSNRSA